MSDAAVNPINAPDNLDDSLSPKLLNQKEKKARLETFTETIDTPKIEGSTKKFFL